MGSKVGNSNPGQSIESLARAFREVLETPEEKGSYLVGKKTKDKCEIDGVARGDVTYLSQRSRKPGPAHAAYRLSGRRKAQHKEASRYLLNLVKQAQDTRNGLDIDQIWAAQRIEFVLLQSRSKGYIKMDDIRGNLGKVLEGLEAKILKSAEDVQKDYGGVAHDISHFLDDVEKIKSGSGAELVAQKVRKQGDGTAELLKQISLVNEWAATIKINSNTVSQLTLKSRSFTAPAGSTAREVSGNNLLDKFVDWPGSGLQQKAADLFEYAKPQYRPDLFKQACKEVLLELAEQEFILSSLSNEFINTIENKEDREKLQALGESVKKLLWAFRSSDSPFARLGDLARAGYNLPDATAQTLVAKRAEYFSSLTSAIPVNVPPGPGNGQPAPANVQPLPANGQPAPVHMQPAAGNGQPVANAQSALANVPGSGRPLPPIPGAVPPLPGTVPPVVNVQSAPGSLPSPSPLAQSGPGIVPSGLAIPPVPGVPPPPLSAAIKPRLYDTESSSAELAVKAAMAKLFDRPGVPPAPLDIPPPPGNVGQASQAANNLVPAGGQPRRVVSNVTPPSGLPAADPSASLQANIPAIPNSLPPPLPGGQLPPATVDASAVLSVPPPDYMPAPPDDAALNVPAASMPAPISVALPGNSLPPATVDAGAVLSVPPPDYMPAPPHAANLPFPDELLPPPSSAGQVSQPTSNLVAAGAQPQSAASNVMPPNGLPPNDTSLPHAKPAISGTLVNKRVHEFSGESPLLPAAAASLSPVAKASPGDTLPKVKVVDGDLSVPPPGYMPPPPNASEPTPPPQKASGQFNSVEKSVAARVSPALDMTPPPEEPPPPLPSNLPPRVLNGVLVPLNEVEFTDAGKAWPDNTGTSQADRRARAAVDRAFEASNVPPPPADILQFPTIAAKLLADLGSSDQTHLTASKVDDGTGHRVVTKKGKVLFLKASSTQEEKGLRSLVNNGLLGRRTAQTKKALAALLEDAERRGLTSTENAEPGHAAPMIKHALELGKIGSNSIISSEGT